MPHSTTSYRTTAEALKKKWSLPAESSFNGEPINDTLARMPGLKFDENGNISYETPGRPGVITCEPGFDKPWRFNAAASVPTYLGLNVDELDMLYPRKGTTSTRAKSKADELDVVNAYADSEYTRVSRSTHDSKSTKAKSIRYSPSTILDPLPRSPMFQRPGSPYPGSEHRRSRHGQDLAFDIEGKAYREAMQRPRSVATSSIYSRPTCGVKTSVHISPASSVSSKSSIGKNIDDTHLKVPVRAYSPEASMSSIAAYLERKLHIDAGKSRPLARQGAYAATAPARSAASMNSGSSYGYGSTAVPEGRSVPGSRYKVEESDEESEVHHARSKRAVLSTRNGPRPKVVAVRNRRTGNVKYERRFPISSTTSQ